MDTTTPDTISFDQDSVYLVEFSDREITAPGEAVSQGYRFHKVFDGYSKLLAEYNMAEERTDTSFMMGQEGKTVLTLARRKPEDGGEFVWRVYKVQTVMQTADEWNTIVILTEGKDANQDESDFADQMYPEYREYGR
jgi:hypothetical protein